MSRRAGLTILRAGSALALLVAAPGLIAPAATAEVGAAGDAQASTDVAAGGEATAEPAAADQAAVPPMTIPGLTSEVLAVLHPDGHTEPAELTELLERINRQVAARVVLRPGTGAEGVSAAALPALGGSGWRLWVFWAVDAPECDGLASALVAVRASGAATIQPVHLCGLRHWEAWTARMNERREALVAAAQAQDQAQASALSAAWRTEVAEFQAEASTFYHGTIPLIGPTATAIALQVDQVPCFRLISPTQRVHALAGFTPRFPLGAWIAACKAWEADRDRRQVPP